MIYRIVYCSRNRIVGTPQEVASGIDSILTVARRNNAVNEITGALLFNGTSFAQVLEGSREAVDATYAKIRCDKRHSDTITLEHAYQVQRNFTNWTMAYSNLQSGQLEPLNFEAVGANPGGFADPILKLLKSLVDTHHP